MPGLIHLGEHPRLLGDTDDACTRYPDFAVCIRLWMCLSRSEVRLRWRAQVPQWL